MEIFHCPVSNQKGISLHQLQANISPNHKMVAKEGLKLENFKIQLHSTQHDSPIMTEKLLDQNQGNWAINRKKSTTFSNKKCKENIDDSPSPQKNGSKKKERYNQTMLSKIEEKLLKLQDKITKKCLDIRQDISIRQERLNKINVQRGNGEIIKRVRWNTTLSRQKQKLNRSGITYIPMYDVFNLNGTILTNKKIITSRLIKKYEQEFDVL